MFDIGWTEMVVVAIIAILFVGPKELPGMLRTFGRAVKKMRGLANEFKGQFDEALKEAELDGVKDTINDVRNLNPSKKIKDHFNPLQDESERIQKSINESLNFDPDELFDESKAPQAPVPQKVDVEAALEKQKQLDAERAAQKAAEQVATNTKSSSSTSVETTVSKAEKPPQAAATNAPDETLKT